MMHDLISRQDAIDAIKEQIFARINWLSDSRMERKGLDVALCVIEDLSSAPPEPHWIPCSERLPEEDGLYLVTTSKGQVQVHVFRHNGNSEEYWMRCNKAWMPLPEPYKED